MNWHMWLIFGSWKVYFGTYMALTSYLSHDVHGAINGTIAFSMLGWLFKKYYMTFGVSASTSTDISVMWCQQHYRWHFYILEVQAIVKRFCMVFSVIACIMLVSETHDVNSTFSGSIAFLSVEGTVQRYHMTFWVPSSLSFSLLWTFNCWVNFPVDSSLSWSSLSVFN